MRYKRETGFLGREIIRRIDDNGSSVSFPLPLPGEDESSFGNEDYLRYLRDKLAGIPIEDPDPPILTYTDQNVINPIRVITTNNTPTILVQYPMPLRTIIVAYLDLDGLDVTNPSAGVATRHVEGRIHARRVNNGPTLANPVVLVDSYIPAAAEAAGSIPVSAVVSGNNIVIRVTGAANRTIHWHLSGRVKVINNDGR